MAFAWGSPRLRSLTRTLCSDSLACGKASTTLRRPEMRPAEAGHERAKPGSGAQPQPLRGQRGTARADGLPPAPALTIFQISATFLVFLSLSFSTCKGGSEDLSPGG